MRPQSWSEPPGQSRPGFWARRLQTAASTLPSALPCLEIQAPGRPSQDRDPLKSSREPLYRCIPTGSALPHLSGSAATYTVAFNSTPHTHTLEFISHPPPLTHFLLVTQDSLLLHAIPSACNALPCSPFPPLSLTQCHFLVVSSPIPIFKVPHAFSLLPTPLPFLFFFLAFIIIHSQRIFLECTSNLPPLSPPMLQRFPNTLNINANSSQDPK